MNLVGVLIDAVMIGSVLVVVGFVGSVASSERRKTLFNRTLLIGLLMAAGAVATLAYLFQDLGS